MCISNGGQNAKNETNMNKINGSANMKLCAKNPATTHTRNRYVAQLPVLKYVYKNFKYMYKNDKTIRRYSEEIKLKEVVIKL